MKVTSIVALLALASSSNAFAPSANARGSTALSMGLQVGESFPKDALKKLGVSGKKSVVYFYGADDAPSCKKQNAAFDEQFASFKKAGAIVVGVRNEKGAKGADVSQTLIVDEGDAIRKEIGIKKDLGILGGRETYVIGKDGKVEYVFNSQFKPEDHVNNALEYLESTAASSKPPFAFFQK